MRLSNFKNIANYEFILIFENGEVFEVNLKDLISKKVSENEISSAKIDSEWGCLEFNDGVVDIEPKTLYKYSIEHIRKREMV